MENILFLKTYHNSYLALSKSNFSLCQIKNKSELKHAIPLYFDGNSLVFVHSDFKFQLREIDKNVFANFSYNFIDHNIRFNYEADKLTINFNDLYLSARSKSEKNSFKFTKVLDDWEKFYITNHLDLI
ncbi:hypothetical protein [Acinetobacter soli]|uniref:hypothetical protein n=1 Tax=Acinetobacter soli TaxID=487316 RepID=UPI00300BF04C